MGQTHTREVFTVPRKFTLTGRPAFYLPTLGRGAGEVTDGLLPAHELMTDEAGPGLLHLEGGMGAVKGGAALRSHRRFTPILWSMGATEGSRDGLGGGEGL